jgi:hypothetical protein
LPAPVGRIAPGENMLIPIDCDGINPAMLPAVNMPTPIRI